MTAAAPGGAGEFRYPLYHSDVSQPPFPTFPDTIATNA
jgi:hypothetical protein